MARLLPGQALFRVFPGITSDDGYLTEGRILGVGKPLINSYRFKHTVIRFAQQQGFSDRHHLIHKDIDF